MLEQANEKALEIISGAKDTAEEVIKETRKLKKQDESQRTKTVQKVREKLDHKKQSIEKHKKLQKKVKTLRPEDIHAGDTVTIVSMDAPATVQEPPNGKGMVRLKAGIMTVELHYTELAAGKESEAKRARENVPHITLNRGKAVPMELDLHGQAVDDALIVLDKYLDDAFLGDMPRCASCTDGERVRYETASSSICARILMLQSSGWENTARAESASRW